MKSSIILSSVVALLSGLWIHVVDSLVTHSRLQSARSASQQRATTCNGIDNPQNPEVILPDGQGTVHGKIDPLFPCVRQFLGIPYGKPPLGKLRFAPPQPASPFGDLDARSLPPSCMQYLMKTPPDIYTRDVLEFNIQGLNATCPAVSEDCLTLSIWTPVLPSDEDDDESGYQGLPVLLFIFGGAFVMGGQDVPYQIPTQWVERSQDHIVITFNYRLNIFGFPNAAGLPLGQRNLGLLDQRLAVQWVHDNIAAFGGDPNRITLWGQSAGAISAGYYQYAYPRDSLITGVIMDSGNEMLSSPLFDDPDNTNFTYVARRFGCAATIVTKEAKSQQEREERGRHELECMRGGNVSAQAITDFIRDRDEALKVPYIFFAPQVDNRTVFTADEYKKRSEKGEVAEVVSFLFSSFFFFLSLSFCPFAFFSRPFPNSNGLSLGLEY